MSGLRSAAWMGGAVLGVAGISGCTSRELDVSYNMYIRNQGNMPLLRAMEEYGPGQCDFWLNDLDARIENAVY